MAKMNDLYESLLCGNRLRLAIEHHSENQLLMRTFKNW